MPHDDSYDIRADLEGALAADELESDVSSGSTIWPPMIRASPMTRPPASRVARSLIWTEMRAGPTRADGRRGLMPSARRASPAEPTAHSGSGRARTGRPEND
jgi:hypothetical protein